MSEREEGRPTDDEQEAPADAESAAKESTEKDSTEETRRPISVRDLLPGPPARPERRSRTDDVEEEQGRDSGEDGGSEGDDGPSGPRVPTPVRVAMDAEDPSSATRAPEELPSRRFEIDGDAWIVRITGRTLTGTRPDAGALLMRLGFFRPDSSDPSDDTGRDRIEPERVLLTVDRPLDVLYEEDLLELFRRSRPVEDDEGVSI